MANKIEYISGDIVNNHRSDYIFAPRNWHAEQCPPDPINLLIQIRLDNRLLTEDVTDLEKSQAKKRWKMLAPGRKVPSGYTVQTAVAFAEAIWLDTIWKNASGHASVINSFFLHSIGAECQDWQYSDIEEITYNGKRIGFSIFNEVAMGAGVDILIDSWLSNVPLEYILAD